MLSMSMHALSHIHDHDTENAEIERMLNTNTHTPRPRAPAQDAELTQELQAKQTEIEFMAEQLDAANERAEMLQQQL